MNKFQEVFDTLARRTQELARSTAADRVAKIRRLYQAVYNRRAEIAQAGLDEVGQDGRGQVLALKSEVDFTCEHLAQWMTQQTAEQLPSLEGRNGYVHCEPKGVVLHLATWNAPILISLSPVVSMLASGNAVVLKPSEIAPRSAELVEKIVVDAGLAEEIAVINGGPEVAQELLRLPFNHICYVGSNRIGRLVMKAAADHFAGVTLEMGGKNPIIVDSEADIEDAAARIVAGKHILAGQACLCPDYILVTDGKRDELIEKLSEKITTFYNPEGKGIEKSADLPRIINDRHFNRIMALIQDALAKGARLVFGGESNPATRYISPTLLVNVTEEMDIFHEEIFGPVMVVQACQTREEVLSEIAKRPKPLGIYIFTANRDAADWYIQHTRAGSTAVNAVAVQATVPSLSFGGVNHSGIGRLGGIAGFREFSNLRGVVEDELEPAKRTNEFYPPFPPEAGDFLDMMIAPPEPTPHVHFSR